MTSRGLLSVAESGTGRSCQSLLYARAVLAADVRGWKSTMALASYSDYEDEDDSDSNKSYSHAEAARARSAFSHEEAWMINLGRDNSNEWLARMVHGVEAKRNDDVDCNHNRTFPRNSIPPGTNPRKLASPPSFGLQKGLRDIRSC